MRTRNTAETRMRLGERRVSGLTTPDVVRRKWIILHSRNTGLCTLGKRYVVWSEWKFRYLVEKINIDLVLQ